MLIELLYFDDCPSWRTTLDNVRTVLPEAEILWIAIRDQAEAEQHRFTGSPTLRIDGRDLFPSNAAEYALGCRLYETPDGLRGWPTTGMIEAALSNLIPNRGDVPMAEKQIAFPVTGMNCNGCVASVTRSLNTLEGVSAVEVSLPGEAVVTFEEGRVTLDDLYARVVKAGYGVPGTPATHGCE